MGILMKLMVGQYSRDDVELMVGLSSLHDALIHSLKSPISAVIESSKNHEELRQSIWGLNRDYENDLERHYRLHSHMVDSFDFLAANIAASRRSEFLEQVSYVISETRALGMFIRNHQDIYGSESFLDYPSTEGNRLFDIRHNVHSEKIFNPEGTYDGLIQGTEFLSACRDVSERISYGLPRIPLDLSFDENGMIHSSELKKNLRMYELALARSGIYFN